MADVKIYENPGNKAARLERENAQLRVENRALRAALGEAHVTVPQVALAGAPTFDQAGNSFTMPGGATVTIGRKPGGGRPSAIPSLQQAVPESAGATSIQIYDANAAQADLEAQLAQVTEISNPAGPTAPARAPQRMVNGQPAAGRGGGMAEFNLGAMRPVPVQPKPQPQRSTPQTPAQPSAVDEAKERFALLELDIEPDQQQTGTK